MARLRRVRSSSSSDRICASIVTSEARVVGLIEQQQVGASLASAGGDADPSVFMPPESWCG